MKPNYLALHIKALSVKQERTKEKKVFFMEMENEESHGVLCPLAQAHVSTASNMSGGNR